MNKINEKKCDMKIDVGSIWASEGFFTGWGHGFFQGWPIGFSHEGTSSGEISFYKFRN